MNKLLLRMEDQKNSYEQKAKETQQKVLEEKMRAEQQLQSKQVWGCSITLGAGNPGAVWVAREPAAQLPGTPKAPPSPLISLSGPWPWPSTSVKSGRASTRATPSMQLSPTLPAQ